MPHGLPRKIRIAFIVQAVLASLALLAGALLSAAVFKHSVAKTAMQEEATYYWQLHRASGTQPPPNTYNLRGYLVPRSGSPLALPQNLRDLGQHHPVSLHPLRAVRRMRRVLGEGSQIGQVVGNRPDREPDAE